MRQRSHSERFLRLAALATYCVVLIAAAHVHPSATGAAEECAVCHVGQAAVALAAAPTAPLPVARPLAAPPAAAAPPHRGPAPRGGRGPPLPA